MSTARSFPSRRAALDSGLPPPLIPTDIRDPSLEYGISPLGRIIMVPAGDEHVAQEERLFLSVEDAIPGGGTLTAE